LLEIVTPGSAPRPAGLPIVPNVGA
jgi:hypothetical protein